MRIVTFLLAALLIATPALAKDKKLVEQVKSAVGILYAQNESGGLDMRCTVTAFEKTAKGYLFLTAAHCVGPDDRAKEHAADPSHTAFFITFDGADVKVFYAATPVFVGYQSRGEDVAVFEVETAELTWAMVPLGDEKKAHDGDDVINVSAPLGLGKQVLAGTIASVYLDRPILEGDINWKGTITLAMVGVNGGSSGSAIVSEDQHAIVGILVGTIGGTTITAIPVSRLKAVRAAVEAGKYRYYSPVVELNPDGSEKE